MNFLKSAPGALVSSYGESRGSGDAASSGTALPDEGQALKSGLLSSYLFWAILFCAFSLRLYLAMTTTYIWDEQRDWIPGALDISFASESLNLPLRMNFHGILPAYLIKIGPVIFGENPLGFRITSVLFGLATVVIVALLAKEWAGTTAALWAAALLAFNEYHVMFSMLAIQKSFFLFFSSAAAYTFFLALDRDKPQWLYATGAFTGLAFLSYEISVLLLPVFAITALFSRHRIWLLRPYPYLAGLVLFAVISPDVISNIYFDEKPEETYSYGDHLTRIGGIGFIKHYFLFYFMEPANYLYDYLGAMLDDGGTEYVAMNGVFGILLFAGVLFWTLVLAFGA